MGIYIFYIFFLPTNSREGNLQDVNLTALPTPPPPMGMAWPFLPLGTYCHMLRTRAGTWLARIILLLPAPQTSSAVDTARNYAYE